MISLDLLLIDDIQYLLGRNALQEKMLYTFDAQYDAHRQMIFASDTALGSLNICERLLSRFKCGLVVEICPPTIADRMKIVRLKARERGARLPEQALDLIAQESSSIRDIESALLKVAGYAAMLKVEANIEVTEEVLRLKTRDRKRIPVELIQDVVCRYYGVSIKELQSRTRARSLRLPRQVAIYLAHQLTDHALEALGQYFDGRDQSTIRHSIYRILTAREQSRELKELLYKLRSMVIGSMR